jgi:uncharacterized protein (AIM24 family)
MACLLPAIVARLHHHRKLLRSFRVELRNTMIRPATTWRCAARIRTRTGAVRTPIAARCISITAADASPEPIPSPQPGASADAEADARFEVVGSPFSLLSVSLAASQQLYTRRGTLVGLSGNAEHTLSSLSFLGPLRRAPVGIPFLYQKISSTSPVTALISTKSPISSIVTVHLDGRQDWLVAQRQALLAWTGQTLSLKPQYNTKLGLAHWGNTYVTGRGLLALVGSGQLYQVQLKAGESYTAHPSNVVAYTASATPPMPFRFKSSRLGFQVPDLGFGTLLQRVKFFRVMGETATWRSLASTFHTLKTWLRRSIWGDRVSFPTSWSSSHLTQAALSQLPRTHDHASPITRLSHKRRLDLERRRRNCGQPPGRCSGRRHAQNQR